MKFTVFALYVEIEFSFCDEEIDSYSRSIGYKNIQVQIHIALVINLRM